MEGFDVTAALQGFGADLIEVAGVGILAGIGVAVVIYGARLGVRLVKSFGK